MADTPIEPETEPQQKKKEEQVVDKYPLPANQDYLSHYVYQGEWRPTRPIGLIGAMTSSPGPAIVNLPSTIGEEGHDPTKTKAPGYKIGIKLRRGEKGLGPGPAMYYIKT
ncbi:outer dense fiber protein 3 [Caerostris extrusa]|uniref:Outer dense fiber protein 3 n=1 Tax=Caerostris extrusa TaxID=172846 RepID=A0AAV4W7Y9_CAEEX|nr:outer dense fiber protein 3 [Caerostris extrusa]